MMCRQTQNGDNYDNAASPRREVWWRDYVGIAFLYTLALLQGIWQGLKQIPGYVRAQKRSYEHWIEKVQKRRVDGKSDRQRYIDAVYGRGDA